VAIETGKALTAPRQRPRQRLDGASTARQLDSQGSTNAVVELSREFEPTGRRFDPRRETRGLGSDTSDDHAAAPALAAPAFAAPASATPAR
jgi:hypothetical protein